MQAETIAELILAVAFGLAAGISGYTFVYARGASYLTDQPEACANCHLMRDYHDGWIKSSHRAVAVCNDCHTHRGLFRKYLTKASNGFWHSWAFTTGRFPDPIRIKPHNREVTERQCRGCHQEIVEAIEGPHGEAAKLWCVRCHSGVGHPS